MQAAVLESRGREGLKLRDFPKPVPKPGEALLRVHAVGLNRVDLYMRDSGVGITHNIVRTFTAATIPALATLRGQRMDGLWKLNVADRDRVDTGKLNRWSLRIDRQA